MWVGREENGHKVELPLSALETPSIGVKFRFSCESFHGFSLLLTLGAAQALANNILMWLYLRKPHLLVKFVLAAVFMDAIAKLDSLFRTLRAQQRKSPRSACQATSACQD
jgi:hypothetical protein